MILEVLYRVKARLIADKMSEFYGILTDGSVESQHPDGQELLASMKRAVMTGDDVLEWYETCFCPTPLKHERATVLDRFFTDLVTETVSSPSTLNGKSFWDYLESSRS